MNICLFDDAQGGHHPGFMTGLATAVLGESVGSVVVASSELQASLRKRTQVEWVRVRPYGLRQVLRGRRVLASVARTCSMGGVTAFWDLYLDKNVWAMSPALAAIPTRVHVLHGVHQYTYEHRTPAGKLRTAYLKRRLARLAARGDIVVVHTTRAGDVLRSFMPPDRVLVLGLPVRSEAELGTLRTGFVPREVPRLLFVGGAYPGKGLHLLLEAVSTLERELIVEVVGPQVEDTRLGLTSRFPGVNIQWRDAYVSSIELRQAYTQASLVVVPYMSVPYAVSGAASTVLLEALAEGTPVLTTTVLESQLPPDYEGAIVVDPNNTATLVVGLSRALRSLSDLHEAARTAGPEFVAKRHTYEAYVRSLIDVSQAL